MDEGAVAWRSRLPWWRHLEDVDRLSAHGRRSDRSTSDRTMSPVRSIREARATTASTTTRRRRWTSPPRVVGRRPPGAGLRTRTPSSSTPHPRTGPPPATGSPVLRASVQGRSAYGPSPRSVHRPHHASSTRRCIQERRRARRRDLASGCDSTSNSMERAPRTAQRAHGRMRGDRSARGSGPASTSDPAPLLDVRTRDVRRPAPHRRRVQLRAGPVSYHLDAASGPHEQPGRQRRPAHGGASAHHRSDARRPPETRSRPPRSPHTAAARVSVRSIDSRRGPRASRRRPGRAIHDRASASRPSRLRPASEKGGSGQTQTKSRARDCQGHRGKRERHQRGREPARPGMSDESDTRSKCHATKGSVASRGGSSLATSGLECTARMRGRSRAPVTRATVSHRWTARRPSVAGSGRTGRSPPDEPGGPRERQLERRCAPTSRGVDHARATKPAPFRSHRRAGDRPCPSANARALARVTRSNAARVAASQETPMHGDVERRTRGPRLRLPKAAARWGHPPGPARPRRRRATRPT